MPTRSWRNTGNRWYINQNPGYNCRILFQVAREERSKAAFSTGADTGIVLYLSLESQWCSINYYLSGATLPAAATAPADKLFVYNEPVEDLQGPEVPKINHLEEVYRTIMFTMSHSIFRLGTPPM